VAGMGLPQAVQSRVALGGGERVSQLGESGEGVGGPRPRRTLIIDTARRGCGRHEPYNRASLEDH
jgi:hypothetical protein